MANGGIASERMQHKLLIVYLLMFVLPCTFLLVCIFQLGMNLGAAGASAPDLRLGILIGLPALIYMVGLSLLFLWTNALVLERNRE